LRSRWGIYACATIAAGLTLSSAPTAASAEATRGRTYIVGQDLDATRGYLASGCCVAPDGLTTYVGLYNVLSPQAQFGGLGLDETGAPITLEADWGGGPISAYKSATTPGVRDLAVGLFIANNDHPNGLAELVGGQHDDKIRQIARLARHVRGVMYLRIGYEFDGVWNKGQDDRALYIKAWRRIVDVLRAERASNIEYVWQASASPLDDLIEGRQESIADWYPGDDYVDWIAFSWFLSPDEPRPLTGGHPVQATRAFMDEVVAMARSRHKPVMIAELAPQGYDLKAGFRANISPLWDGPPRAGLRPVSAEDIWRDWGAPLFAYLEANRDVIHAVAYINTDWDSQDLWNAPYEGGFWGDTRLQTNPQLSKLWNQAITQWRNTQ